jgi:hypothetical protein
LPAEGLTVAATKLTFQEMESLAKAPQARVNQHVIEVLDRIEGNQVDQALLVGRHETRLTEIEKRCSGCTVKVKALWAACGAVALAVLGWLKFGK